PRWSAGASSGSPMKRRASQIPIHWIVLSLPLALVLPAPAADPASLKDAFAPHFRIGVAVNRGIVTGGPSFRRSAEWVERDALLVRTHFNSITAENDMKWQLIHPREGSDGYDFGPADAFVEFGLRHGMEIVGHTLVWHNQTPDWVFAGTNPPPAREEAAGRGAGPGFSGPRRYDGPRASREELVERMRQHIHTVVGRYKGRVRIWDVVNEALADGDGTIVLRNSLWHEIIGPDYVAMAFRFAHQADP